MTGAVQFRIYTENKNRPQVEQMATGHLGNYSSFTGEGVWNGGREHSLIIEWISTPLAIESFRALAEAIKKLNHQEAVLVTMQHIESEVI